MNRRPIGLACALLVAVCVACHVAAAPAAPGPAAQHPSVTGVAAVGEARIAPRLIARYEYHYDRNALSDSRQLGAATFVALTTAGNVVAFAGESLKPARERLDPIPATSLGQDEAGAVLVGYRDGRLMRVDESFSFTLVANLPGAIAWIGYRRAKAGSPGGPVVLVRRTKLAEVHDLAKRRVHVVKDLPSAVLLDSKARLWMGADHGEFGGWCRVLDLDSGSIRRLAMPGQRHTHADEVWDGVYGFIELSGGEVWAYGGLAHMGLHEGYVIRVDAPRRLGTFGGIDPPRGGSTAPPDGPITLIVNDRSTEDILVLSYSDIYRVDRQLRRWRRIHTLNVHYRWGRPDAVGSYPSIRALQFVDGGKTMLLATLLDGYVRVRAGTEEQLAVGGQIGARSIDRIENTREGQLFIEDDLTDVVWRLDGGVWRTANLAPPFQLDPAESSMRPPLTSWHQTKLLTGPNGELLTVNASGTIPGTVTTAARRNGVAVVLGREVSDLSLSRTFVTRDGQLWNVWYGDINRFAGGRWTTVGAYRASPPEQSPGIDTGFRLRALPVGPPWIILDTDLSQLLTLTPDAGPVPARVAQVVVTDSVGRARQVLDAIPWSEGELLLATDAGLALYAMAAGRLVDAPLAASPRAVTRLYQDGKNRLWLGGQGLWMIEGRGGALQSFDALPMIAGSTVEAIAADAEHPDGVVVSLGERGIVRLRLSSE